MQKVRYAPPDPTLPKPWRGLVDSATSNLYFWNPETNVATYVRPTADLQPPHPDLDNRSDRSYEIHELVNLGGCGDDVNNGDPSHLSSGVNRDTSSQLNNQQSVPAFEALGEDHGHNHESTVLAKRKDTSESHTPKKQKTTSPPSVIDDVAGHIEESIMKPIEVSYLVDKEEQESDEVHKLDQLAKEKRKMSEVEVEVPPSAFTNGAELLQANRSETFEMNVISSICTTLVAKETGNSLPEEMPIVDTDMNQELLSVADGRKVLGEEMIDREGLTDQDSGPIIDNMSNGNIDCPMIDSTQIETNLEKQPINRSLAPQVNKVEEDMACTQSINRLAGVTDQLSETVEAKRYMIQYAVSAQETNVQRRCENEELKKNVADLKKKIADLETKLKESMRE